MCLSVQQPVEVLAMKGINHLVVASHDLEALRSAYHALGFALKQRGGLPFGISNSIVQLQGSYLELLSVAGDVGAQPRTFFLRCLQSRLPRAPRRVFDVGTRYAGCSCRHRVLARG